MKGAGSVLQSILMGLLLMPVYTRAEVITGAEEGTGRLFWEWREAGISLQLVQLLPDQVRAFYLGRGFGRAEADLIADNCLFQTIFRNNGASPLSYDLETWRVSHQGKTSGMMTRARWDEKWSSGPVSKASRIAMRWALLPTRQSFEPGDYNWGMTAYGLAPGSEFDLIVNASMDGQEKAGVITGIVCAPDHETMKP